MRAGVGVAVLIEACATTSDPHPGASRRPSPQGGGLSPHRGFDRGDRGFGLAAVGAAGLGHVGTAAAALAAERFGALAHQLDRVEAAVRSSVTPTTRPPLPSGAVLATTTTPEPSFGLALVGERLELRIGKTTHQQSQ